VDGHPDPPPLPLDKPPPTLGAATQFSPEILGVLQNPKHTLTSSAHWCLVGETRRRLTCPKFAFLQCEKALPIVLM